MSIDDQVRGLNLYQSHKQVWAAPILRIEALPPTPDAPPASEGSKITWAAQYSVLLAVGVDETADRTIDGQVFARGMPAPNDYLVVYADGYISWSPRQAFEDGYRLVKGN